MTIVNYIFIIYYASLQVNLFYRKCEPLTVLFIKKTRAKYSICLKRDLILEENNGENKNKNLNRFKRRII